VGISESCFIFDFASLPSEAHLAYHVHKSGRKTSIIIIRCSRHPLPIVNTLWSVELVDHNVLISTILITWVSRVDVSCQAPRRRSHPGNVAEFLSRRYWDTRRTLISHNTTYQQLLKVDAFRKFTSPLLPAHQYTFRLDYNSDVPICVAPTAGWRPETQSVLPVTSKIKGLYGTEKRQKLSVYLSSSRPKWFYFIVRSLLDVGMFTRRVGYKQIATKKVCSVDRNRSVQGGQQWENYSLDQLQKLHSFPNIYIYIYIYIYMHAYVRVYLRFSGDEIQRNFWIHQLRC